MTPESGSGSGSGGGTGSSNHFGDHVVVNGSGNIGIVKNQSPTIAQQAAPTTPQEAIHQLERLLLELRAQVAPAGAGTIDSNLPVIVSAESGPEARHGALMAVLGLATLAGGEVGRAVIEAVGRVLELLSLA
ncbi:hypothetical protein [Streptomyces sp. NPDC002104]